MITIGVDAHKTVHAAVALDDTGREVDRWRGDNGTDGGDAVLRWARAVGEARRWGIEGSGTTAGAWPGTSYYFADDPVYGKDAAQVLGVPNNVATALIMIAIVVVGLLLVFGSPRRRTLA